MPVNQESTNRELYGLLKSRGYRPDMFSSSGKKVSVPDEAEAFQFDFIKGGKSYGKVTATIDGLHRLILYYGSDVANSPRYDSDNSDSDPSFSDLRKHLKRFAKNRGLGFELQDEDNLEADMAKREYNKKEGLTEGYHPINRQTSYSDNVPNTKIILQHNRKLEEGEQRYRNIAKIFVENAQGERFLLPTTKPGIARVYARHIAEGGTPYDERGAHITTLVEEYSKMAGFVRATKNKQFNESAQKLINEGVNHYNHLRETLHKMAGKRGYREYFENYTPTLMEEEGADLSEMFMQSSLDPRIESVMPILSKLSKNITEDSLNELSELEEWADQIIEGVYDIDLPDPEEDDKETVDEQDFGTQVINKGGQMVIDKMRNLSPDFRKTYQNLTPGSEYYQKNIANNPALVKRAADATAMMTPDQFDDQVADVQQRFTKVINTPGSNLGKSQTSPEYDNIADKMGLPNMQENELTPVTTGHKGLNPQQKKAGQLGATEKVSTGPILGEPLKSQKGLRGKLVGAESVDPLIRLKGLSGLQ